MSSAVRSGRSVSEGGKGNEQLSMRSDVSGTAQRPPHLARD